VLRSPTERIVSWTSASFDGAVLFFAPWAARFAERRVGGVGPREREGTCRREVPGEVLMELDFI
jgi:hypothetical protein